MDLWYESRGGKLARVQLRPVAFWKHLLDYEAEKDNKGGSELLSGWNPTSRTIKERLIYETMAAGLLISLRQHLQSMLLKIEENWS